MCKICFESLVNALSLFLFAVLEVFMWARDAQSAEAWLFAQEQYLKSEDYGVSSL